MITDNNSLGFVLCEAPLVAQSMLYEQHTDIQEGEDSAWNYGWIIPVNLIVNIAAIIFAPLAVLFNLVAAAGYGCAALGADGKNKLNYIHAANGHGILAGLHLSILPLFNLANSVFPFYDGGKIIQQVISTADPSKA